MKKICFFLLFATLTFASESIPFLRIICSSDVSSEYVEASFEFANSIEPISTVVQSENLKKNGLIRIRGNSTATSPKKPYNIKFDSKVNFFNMGAAKKWVLLSNPFDPTLIRNKLIFDLASKLSFEFSPKSYYINIWLNDTFMGNYQLVQNVEFQKTRIPYDVESGDFLFERVTKRKKAGVVYAYSPIDSVRVALNEPEAPTDEQLDDFQKKMEAIEKAINSSDFNEYIQYVDLQSMIDYYWIEEFVHDPDLHTGSVFFTIHDGILRGGPAWDFDLALGNTTSDTKSKTSGIHAKDFWWAQLFKDPVFEKIANERFLELSPYFENMAKNNELGENQIDSLLLRFGDSFLGNFSDSGWAYCTQDEPKDSQKRFLTCPYSPLPAPTFKENVENLRSWIIERNKYLKGKAMQTLERLDSIDISLATILEIQDSIMANRSSVNSSNNSEKNSHDSIPEIAPAPKIFLLSNVQPKNFLNVFLYNKEKRRTRQAPEKKQYLINGKIFQKNSSNILLKR